MQLVQSPCALTVRILKAMPQAKGLAHQPFYIHLNWALMKYGSQILVINCFGFGVIDLVFDHAKTFIY